MSNGRLPLRPAQLLGATTRETGYRGKPLASSPEQLLPLPPQTASQPWGLSLHQPLVQTTRPQHPRRTSPMHAYTSCRSCMSALQSRNCPCWGRRTSSASGGQTTLPNLRQLPSPLAQDPVMTEDSASAPPAQDTRTQRARCSGYPHTGILGGNPPVVGRVRGRLPASQGRSVTLGHTPPGPSRELGCSTAFASILDPVSCALSSTTGDSGDAPSSHSSSPSTC